MLGFIPMLSFECKISIHSAENPARQGSSETAPMMMKETDFSTVAAFEAVEFILSCSVNRRRNGQGSRVAARIVLRELLDRVRRAPTSRQSARRLRLDRSARSLNQYFLHRGEYGGWGVENRPNDFGHTFAAAWRKFNLALLGVRDKFRIGEGR